MNDLFTKQEKIFISFLIGAVIIGAGIDLYRSHFKTVSTIVQAENFETFEKQIYEKTVLIDSLLDERTDLSNIENIADTGKISTIVNSTRKLSQDILRIEINDATIYELVQLPQIGPVIATRIVEYRTTHGKFKNIEDLINIKGIGEKKLNAIKPHIYIKQK